jgi:2-methylisocitrate lyase-like PEP mutase family enzyme
VIFPISTLLVATAAMRTALEQIKRDGSPMELLDGLLPFNDFLDFIGMPEIRELEERFASTQTDTTTP